MKIKSKAVRRNSGGYRLQDDEPVSGTPAVVSNYSVRPDSSDLGVADSFLAGSGSVSSYVVNEGGDFGDFIDVDDRLVPDHVWDSVGATSMRMTGGIVISEPGSSCGPRVNRCHRLPDPSGYIGKGKGKVDDVPPSSSHVAGGFSDACRVSAMPPSVPNESAIGVLPANCEVASATRAAMPLPAHVSFDINAGQHQEPDVADYPFTIPVGMSLDEASSSGCHPSFAAADGGSSSVHVPFSVNTDADRQGGVSHNPFAVPAGAAAGCSANGSCAAGIGTHQPVTGSGSHFTVPVATPSCARRRQHLK